VAYLMHMEDPIKRLSLISHYICMHALTLKVYIFNPNLTHSLTSCEYSLERYSANILANTDLSVGVLSFLQVPFSPLVLEDLITIH
jgi:hypothetical protein